MPIYPATLRNQMGAKLDTFGLLQADPNLFADLQLPEGLNKQLCIDTILQLHGAAPLAHPDPHWMRYMIGAFSRRHFRAWEKLYKTTLFSYNPIWNKDSYETTTDTTQRSTTGTGTLDSTVDGQHTSEEKGSNTAKHTEKESSTTENAAESKETRTTDTTGNSTADGTSHAQTDGSGTTDGTSTTDTTNNRTTKDNSSTDSTTESTGSEETEEKSVHDISPENAPDYQPDDTTTNTGNKSTTGNTSGHSETESTGSVTDIGNSHTVTHGESTSTETTDGTTHSETDTAGHEDMNGTLQSTANTTFDRTAGSEDGAEHTINVGASDKTVTDTDTTSSEDMSETFTHEYHQWGNIGVTTTQQMIGEERESVQFEVYSVIAAYYHREFCLKFY